MEQGRIPLNVPIELPVEFVNQVSAALIKHFEKRLKYLERSYELPPYPNKSEVREILKIGDDKLNRWILDGLKVQQWSKQDIRIERSELQQFLRENFEI